MDNKLLLELNQIIEDGYNRRIISSGHKLSPQIYKDAIQRALSEKWIYEHSTSSCRLTDLGYKIYEDGGVEKFLEKQSELTKLKEKVDKLTQENLRLNNLKLKYWWLYMIGGAIIGAVITFLVPRIYALI